MTINPTNGSAEHSTALTFAYYCSGHGYGHATRVSAFASHLLSLQPQPTVHIVSSAPQHVFADSIALGALYRYAKIDPVIVQPLAYRVDRQSSVKVLKSFLDEKDIKLEEEKSWLLKIHADCVLSDAAFLGCLAARAACIPSALVTNFTFDSVYSYLSTSLLDLGNESDHLQPSASSNGHLEALVPDIPVSHAEIDPLVEQIFSGYRCADLLLLLPGNIPIPSFSVSPALPSSDWVDPQSNKLHADVITHLSHTAFPLHSLHPPLTKQIPCSIPRSIQPAPLLVRSPNPSVYAPSGRSSFLTSIGVPSHLHNLETVKVLIVSFGGQTIRRPSSRNSTPSRSRLPSIESSPFSTARPSYDNIAAQFEPQSSAAPATPQQMRLLPDNRIQRKSVSLVPRQSLLDLSIHSALEFIPPKRIVTPSHLWVPGAPPASKPMTGIPVTVSAVTFSPAFVTETIPPTPERTSNLSNDQDGSKNVKESQKQDNSNDGLGDDSYFNGAEEFTGGDAEGEGPKLLPDESWIAIVCGVSKEQWSEVGESGEDSGLPDGFFIAPRDVYMPDLTAVGDVLLGKLGYGTVSECVDSSTPFVYVSRPLFVEEHGLRLLLDREGVGIELSRQSYEAGEWASAVDDAYLKGREAKTRKRAEGETGRRTEEGREMAKRTVEWVRKWKRLLD